MIKEAETLMEEKTDKKVNFFSHIKHLSSHFSFFIFYVKQGFVDEFKMQKPNNCLRTRNAKPTMMFAQRLCFLLSLGS